MRFIDADLIEYHEEYDGQGFTRVAYADDIENLPTVELFDKERLKFVIEKNFGHGTIEPILQLIDAQQTFEIVTCKYCKHYKDSVCYNPSGLPRYLDETDFCSNGEREKDE